MTKKLLILFTLLITTIVKAQDCDILSAEWENPTPTIVVYTYMGGYVTGVPDPASLINFTDAKTIYEGHTSPNPGVTPVGSVRIGFLFLNDANDNLRIDVNIYDDASGRPGTLVGGVTDLSPTQLGVGSGTSSRWIILPTNPVPTTSRFYIGVVIHAGDVDDTLLIQANSNGQGNADNSNSITTSRFGNEILRTIYNRDIDLNMVPRLGVYEDPSFNYANTTYCPNATDPLPTITGQPGGTFTSSPAGLSINPVTGSIDISASTINTYTVTYTTNGVCPQSEDQIVTIQDIIVPAISCPSDQNVFFDNNCQFVLSDYTSLATASDNCSTPTVTQLPVAGTVITTTQTITLTANDGNGNIAQCTFEVIPSDNTLPVISCPDNQNVSFDENCEFVLPDYTGLATATDNCSTPTVTQSPVAGTVITTTQTITLTANDGNGNIAQCTFEVIPSDNTLPIITCPITQNVNFNTNCEFILPDYTSLSTATDNCSTPTVSQSPVVGTIITGTQIVTLTALDSSGNISQCTFEVIPSDTTLPVISCPVNQTENLDLNGQFILPDYTGLATATDNCSTPTVTQLPVAGTVITANQTITLTANDGNGNTAQCTFEVSVIEKVETQILTNSENPTNQSLIVISIVFSESVIGLTTSDLIVTNGTVSNLLGSGSFYTAEITPTTNGLITVNINSDVVTGLSGNGNLPANTFTIMYDSTAPLFTVSFTDTQVNLLNEENVEFVISDGEIGAIYNYTITSLVNSSQQISGSGTITSQNEVLFENLSAFPNGNIELVVILTDAVGNESAPERDEILKVSGANAQRIPEGFSPNGDGVNDTWIIPGIEQYPNNKVSVFNRYGKVVWEINGYDNGGRAWNGEVREKSIMGSNSTDGTYYYVIDYGANQTPVKSGYVILKK